MGEFKLDGLNPNQLLAVNSIDGVYQLCSVAGSGKTRVLTYRIGNMIKNFNIDPKNICVTTFTKKAAEEMIDRLKNILSKDEIDALTIGTFHSIGYKILRNEYRLMNHPMKDFELLNGGPQKWMIREILDDLKINVTQSYNENIFITEINELKMNLISPEGYVGMFLIETPGDHEKNLLNVYTEYEKRKDQKKVIDFNDMLYKAYYLLVSNPKILKKYQNKIKYILVDEAQDNNLAQYSLVEILAEPHNNIFIVGDDDQSIYKFRGALPEKFIQFKNQYDTTVINLEENYRSLPHILEAANKLIKNNTIRVKKELIPFRKANNENEEVEYMVAEDEDREALLVADKILEKQKEGKKFNDMAIIYRTNAQARAIEDQMINNGIPYVIFNGISFYERSEVKDMIAYLKLATNPDDDSSLKRIINKPSRYLGKKFMQDLEDTAKNKKCSLYKALSFVNIKGKTLSNVYNFLDNIKSIKSIISISKNLNKNVGNVLTSIRETIKYDAYLVGEGNDEEDNIRIENLNSLSKAASKYLDVKDFLNFIDIMNNVSNNTHPNAVKLMTIHKSKGLEYPIVFMIGMSDGLLPHANSKDIEEERRLAYVGITRAQDYLLLTSPLHYQGKAKYISEFIQEGEFANATSQVAIEA